jgi:hypothetical protein
VFAQHPDQVRDQGIAGDADERRVITRAGRDELAVRLQDGRERLVEIAAEVRRRGPADAEREVGQAAGVVTRHAEVRGGEITKAGRDQLAVRLKDEISRRVEVAGETWKSQLPAATSFPSTC